MRVGIDVLVVQDSGLSPGISQRVIIERAFSGLTCPK